MDSSTCAEKSNQEGSTNDPSIYSCRYFNLFGYVRIVNNYCGTDLNNRVLSMYEINCFKGILYEDQNVPGDESLTNSCSLNISELGTRT